MAIHEEAVHVTNADLPDEHVGGLFVLYGLRAVQEKGAKQPPCDPTCLEPGKVLCFMFSFAIMGVEPSKFKTWLCVLIQLADRTIVIM